MNSMKNQRGFTLIELMLTLIVAGVLMAMAAPSFINVIKNNRLTTQANEFITAMNLARSEAIKRGTSIDVTAATAAADGWQDGWTVELTDGTDLRIFDALVDNLVLTSNGGFSSFQYNSRGMVNNADTLDLCDDRSGETGRQISITATGRVSIIDLVCP